MLATALGLIAATAWSISDYLAGLAGKRARSITVTVAMQAISGLIVLPIVLLFDWHPTTTDIVLGVLAGLATSAGMTLYVEGAAAHGQGVVAPVGAVAGTAVPVMASVILGESLGLPAWVGICLAIVAIALIATSATARASADPDKAGAMLLGISSGVLVGVAWVLLSQTSEASGLWPLLSQRVSLIPALAYAHWKHAPFIPPRGARGLIIATTMFAVSGLAAFTYGARMGSVGVVAVLASMSPAGTVVLSRVLDKEPMNRQQIVGIGLALAAIALLISA